MAPGRQSWLKVPGGSVDFDTPFRRPGAASRTNGKVVTGPMSRTPNITRAARRIRDAHAIPLTAAKAIAQALHARGWLDDDQDTHASEVAAAAAAARARGNRITPAEADAAFTQSPSPAGAEVFTSGVIGDDDAELWQNIAANDPTHVSYRPSHPYVGGDGPHGLQTGRGGTGKSLNPAYVIALFALRAAADEVLIVTSRPLDPVWVARSLVDDPRLSLAEPDTAADTLRSLIERRTRAHLRPALVAVDESAATPELFAMLEGLSNAMHAVQTYVMWGSTHPTKAELTPAIRACHARWEAATRTQTLRAEIGTTADGTPVTIDLGPDTPALMSFTGPGTTNALTVAVTSLEHGYGPNRVQFMSVAARQPVPVAEGFTRPTAEEWFRTGDVDDMKRLRDLVEAELDTRAQLLHSGATSRETLGELVVVVDDYAPVADGAAGKLLDETLTQIGHVGRSEGVRALIGISQQHVLGRGLSSNCEQVTLEHEPEGLYKGIRRDGEFTPHDAGTAFMHGQRAQAANAAVAMPVHDDPTVGTHQRGSEWKSKGQA